MSEQSKTAVLIKLGQALEILPLAIPELHPGQVLVDVAYSGVCHSQLMETRGLRGEDRFLPHTLGHEGSGGVLKIGKAVTKVKPGDPVVLSWIKDKGSDVASTTYESPEGAINSGAISTFMQKAVISENCVTAIPASMPLREAALLGCAIPTGMGVVLNTAGVRPDSSVAVFGVGGIGLCAVMAARLAKASPIIAVDLFDHKLAQARRVGATHVINASNQNPLKSINEITSGRGMDYTFEAAGKPEAMEMAFQSVRDKGGLCVLAGNLAYGRHISLNPFDLIKGKRIIGSWGGESQPGLAIPRYVLMYLSGELPLDLLITHEYSLEEINLALDALEEGKVGRILIDMSKCQN